jgi:tryptophanyl-tRNA synthetase
MPSILPEKCDIINDMKPVLVSGIQPTGRLHIGNYLGALKQFVDLQNSEKYQCYFFLADLHALTENPDADTLHNNILHLTADFLAAGIDPKRSTLFQQSQSAAHTEIAWVLNTIAPMGELERMTQFKDKSLHQANNINVGLFNYPILMAADILFADAAVVPVGEDQLQHLELTRTLARKFNKRFGKTFIEPKNLLTKTPRVMSLKNPEKKMSKSQPEGCLFLDDTPKHIAAKIARAVTDSDSHISYDPDKKPGLANLLEIYGALSDQEPKAVAKQYADKTYAEFKAALTTVVADHFAEFRTKKAALLAKPNSLISIINEGSRRAMAMADKKMADVRSKIGLSLE